MRRLLALCLLLTAVPVVARAQIAPVAPVLRQAFQDANGQPLNGGKLCTYAAGTTTPKLTYHDDALVTQWTNPIVLGADGRMLDTWYWSAALYKVVVLTAASTTTDCLTGTMSAISTIDNVPAVADLATLGSGAASIDTFLRGDGTWATLSAYVTSSAIGTQNNFNPGIVGTSTVVQFTNASALTVTGFAGGVFAGQQLFLENAGSSTVALSNGDAGSLAQNRLTNFVVSGYTYLAPGGTATYVYNSGIWLLASHSQGAWLPNTGSLCSAVGAVGCTPPGNVTMAFWLSGTTLSVRFTLANATVSGPTATLSLSTLFYVPATATNGIYQFTRSSDNGAGVVIGMVVPGGGANSTLTLYGSLAGAGYSASTANTNVTGTWVGQVQ